MRKLVRLVALMTILSVPYELLAKDTINWAYFSYPPLYIVERGKVSGIGIDIQNLLWQNMPEYEHQRIETSVQRMFENMKHGQNYCVIGPLKTPEREEFLHYSIPCRLDIPDMLAIRKEDKQKLGIGLDVSLEELMQSNRFIFGNQKGISHGKLDAVIKKYEGKQNIVFVSGSEPDDQLLNMLAAKRIDGLITSYYTLKKFGFYDKVTLIPIREYGDMPMIGYITCPKNEWGKQVIEKIDAALRKEIPTERYLQCYLPYIDQNMVPEFRKRFEEYILKPSKQ